MRSPLLAMVLCLVGEAFPLKLRFVRDWGCVYSHQTGDLLPARTCAPIRLRANDSVILQLVNGQGYIEESGSFIITGDLYGNYPTTFVSEVRTQQWDKFVEENKCATDDYNQRAIGIVNIWKSTGETSTHDFGTKLSFNPNSYTSQQITYYSSAFGSRCTFSTVSEDTKIYTDYQIVSSLPSDIDTCTVVSDAGCRECAWPYIAKSAGENNCGCSVDRNKVQPEQLLKNSCGVWCQTAGNDGSQYYIDPSLSNFNASVGQIRCACSSPMTGKTVYRQAGVCPIGTALVDTVNDTTGQDYNDLSADTTTLTGGNSNDTETHNRLDTIIGQIKAIRDYLDTVGNGTDTGFWANERDSAISGLDTALNGIGDITDAVEAHSNRGDTTGYNGYTLDSLLDICAPYGDSVKCMSQESTYPMLIASAKWIIRACLFLWGVLMFWMFLSIAKSED